MTREEILKLVVEHLLGKAVKSKSRLCEALEALEAPAKPAARKPKKPAK